MSWTKVSNLVGPVGPPGLTFRGAWQSSVHYVKNDVTTYGGSSYCCILPVGPTPTPPPGDVDSWSILASQGPPGPMGPAGPPGGLADVSYRFVQATAASTWTINHPLSFYPSVTVVDSTHRTVLGEISYPTANQVVVKFTGAFSGEAYLT